MPMMRMGGLAGTGKLYPGVEFAAWTNPESELCNRSLLFEVIENIVGLSDASWTARGSLLAHCRGDGALRGCRCLELPKNCKQFRLEIDFRPPRADDIAGFFNVDRATVVQKVGRDHRGAARVSQAAIDVHRPVLRVAFDERHALL